MSTLTGVYDLDFTILLSMDYKEILTICNVNKYYQSMCSDNSFWKQKFALDFPTSNYFKEWSWKKNYLIKAIKIFTLILNLNVEHSYVSPYLYENQFMAKLMLNDAKQSIVIDDFDYVNGDIPSYINIDIDLNYRYVAIKETDHYQQFKIIGYNNNLKDLHKQINADSVFALQEIYFYSVAVIDLVKMIPCFNNQMDVPKTNKNYVTFYKIK